MRKLSSIKFLSYGLLSVLTLYFLAASIGAHVSTATKETAFWLFFGLAVICWAISSSLLARAKTSPLERLASVVSLLLICFVVLILWLTKQVFPDN